MANALYAKAKEAFLKGLIDLSGANIKAVLVRASGYTPNLATDEFYSSVGGTVGTPVALAGKAFATASNYVTFDATDTTFTAVPAGAAIDYILLFNDTGVPATSRLIYLIDTMTGLPVTPGGGDIVARWDNGANLIFKWQG